MSQVIVLGSVNVDQILTVGRIPTPGETVLATGSRTARGGKGQNQAVAAARSGATTGFIGAVGSDSFGVAAAAEMTVDGVDVALLRVEPGPTGAAYIAVDGTGENTIIVDPAANALLRGLSKADRAAIQSADVLLMQLEVPLGAVIEAAEVARAAGTLVLLNAAPICALPDSLLAAIDILFVNEHELARLAADRPGADLGALVPVIVVTLGSRGARLRGRTGESLEVPAPLVTAVDATGAGDTFCGAFAAAIANGAAHADAIRFAVTAASLSVELSGAVPSIPTRARVEERLSEVA